MTNLWPCLVVFFGLIHHAIAQSYLLLEEVSVGLYPNSRPLTNAEIYTLRDAIELVLQDSLMHNSAERSTPSKWAGITYVGLERVLKSTYSPEGVVQVSMDGLVYFFVPRGDTYIPTNEEFMTWISQEILTADVLLEAAKAVTVDGALVFQNLTYAAVWEEFYEHHSAAPTALPSVVPTATPTRTLSLAPTASPTVIPTVTPTASPTRESIRTSPPSKASSSQRTTENAVIAAGAGGGAAFLLILLVCCWCCKRKGKDRQLPGAAEKEVASSPNSKTVCSDEEESSEQTQKTADPPIARKSLFGYARKDSEMDEMSSESFEEESFDDNHGFANAEKIQPHIVVPNQQEVFPPRVYNIRKDMLESSATTAATTSQQPRSLLGLPPVPPTQNGCVLEPTDVSAASLAEAGLSRDPSIRSDPGRQSFLVPKVVQNAWSRDEKTEDVSSMDGGGSNFSGWDPDETSSAASEDNFFSSSIPNPAEQSLLQHSLRSESFKLKRLRSPELEEKEF
eukprot:scaffold2401_cov111-Cylindrotheca_fusiformis.AAC.2